MRSTQHLIPALEQITESANDILDSLPTVDVVTIAVILQACDGNLERAAQIMVNLTPGTSAGRYWRAFSSNNSNNSSSRAQPERERSGVHVACEGFIL